MGDQLPHIENHIIISAEAKFQLLSMKNLTRIGTAGITMMGTRLKNCLFSQMLPLMSGFMANYRA
jgi:hypothetical protein